MLIAVIRRGTRFLRDRYRHFGRDRIDLQRSVNNHKLDVREVLIGVLKVASLNAYRIFANVRSLGRPRFGRRFLHAGVYVIQLIVSRHALVARNRMLIAVIRRGTRFLRDRYRHCVRDRRDRHITVNDFANRYVIVGALNIEAVRLQTHIRSSDFRPLRFRRHTVLQCDLYVFRQFAFIIKL